MQCAAVSTQSGAISVPPQRCCSCQQRLAGLELRLPLRRAARVVDLGLPRRAMRAHRQPTEGIRRVVVAPRATRSGPGRGTSGSGAGRAHHRHVAGRAGEITAGAVGNLDRAITNGIVFGHFPYGAGRIELFINGNGVVRMVGRQFAAPVFVIEHRLVVVIARGAVVVEKVILLVELVVGFVFVICGRRPSERLARRWPCCWEVPWQEQGPRAAQAIETGTSRFMFFFRVSWRICARVY